MSLYTIILFLHLSGAVTLFAALGVEWRARRALRSATTMEELRTLTGILAAQPALNGIAATLILLPGFYLATKKEAWSQGWISLALLATLLMAGLGMAVTAPRVRKLKNATATGTGAIPQALREGIPNPVMRMSFNLRVLLGFGILLLMATRLGYGASSAVIGIAVVIGLAISFMGHPASSVANSAGK